MMPSASLISHWYYHIPDLLMKALIYLLLARLVLAVFWRAQSGPVIVRILHQVTNPVLKAVAAITPRVAPPGVVIVFAVVWLMFARLALFIAVTARGVRLALG